MANAREFEAESTPILEEVRVSRRGFVRLSLAAVAGFSLFGASACGGGQDDDGDGGNDNGRKKEDNKDGGGGGGGY
jgi:hypothetical protein